MIAFASLFLGLTLGVQPVEVVVGDAVAAVELRLDGERVGVMREPPWTLDCDFGPELAPRLLEAVALDAADREIGRARQWLNLPQPSAVISVVLEAPEPGKPRVARLSWESSAGAEPESVTATLDGEPLAVDDPHRLVLPPVDESQLHLLQVEMKFEGRVAPRVDLTFGGAYTDEVSTEMTALPVWTTGKGRPPTAEDADGWFVEGGEPLEVITVEKGEAEVVVVMGRPFPHLVMPGERYKAPKELTLERGLGFRFLSPLPEASQGVATTFELFPISRAFDYETADDLYGLLTRLLRPNPDVEPRLTSAVAVAGLAAYGGRNRRAVIFIPPSDFEIDDALAAGQARRYLERLGVPLYVWDPESKPDPELLEAWGAVRSVGSMKKLADAFEELTADLDRQWVVWLDGRHLPQDVALAEGVDGFSLSP